MSEAINPVYALALGALWTAGRDLYGRARSELKMACGYSRPADLAQYLKDGGAREAARALREVGLPLSDVGQVLADSPDGGGLVRGDDRLEALRMAAPLTAEELAQCTIPTRDPALPCAGDMVELAEPWTFEQLRRVGLQGRVGEHRAGLTCANPRGSWCYSRTAGSLSMGSGGPASMMYLDLREAKATGETVPFRVWSFESVPAAHTAVHWLRDVPLWRLERTAWLDWEAAEEPITA